jgi:SAM-dependent methyltransferase
VTRDPIRPKPGEFEREWRRRFESFAKGADTEHQVSGWSEAGLRRRVAAFEHLLSPVALGPKSRVLDLGSGGGTYVRLLGARGHHAVGVDYSVPSLERARAADPERLGDYVSADAYTLPFPDRTFHLIVMIGIFQALAEPERVLAEARRVVRPGGHLLLEVLNAQELFIFARTALDRARRRPPGVRSYRRSKMEGWLRSAGFRPLGSAPVFLPPRKYPLLERVLDHPIPNFLLRVGPGASAASAAAFLILSRRD